MHIRTKDEIEQAEDNWDMVATKEGYRCNICGCQISYDEREIYFRTKHCGWCDHRENNDD